MKSIWLGQGGLLLISGKLKIVVDPYLSNGMREIDRTMKRRLKIDRRFLRIKPDMIILTNSHPDHADMKTLKKYLHKTRKRTVVLASEKAYDKVYRERIAGRYTNIMFEEGDEWTLKHILVKGVRCKTDDKTAFGVVIEDSLSDEKVYIAGNTLYNRYLIQELPKNVDVAYIPISGQYSTMNIEDAQRFVKELGAKKVVPFHYGMFDKVNPKEFVCENKVVSKPYSVIPLDNETEETKKMTAEERLALGLEEKPVAYPKNLKQAIKAEKANDKAFLMRKQLVDVLQKYVECDDPTLTDVSVSAVRPAIGGLPLPETDTALEEDSFDTSTLSYAEISAEEAKIDTNLELEAQKEEPATEDVASYDAPEQTEPESTTESAE